MFVLRAEKVTIFAAKVITCSARNTNFALPCFTFRDQTSQFYEFEDAFPSCGEKTCLDPNLICYANFHWNMLLRRPSPCDKTTVTVKRYIYNIPSLFFAGSCCWHVRRSWRRCGWGASASWSNGYHHWNSGKSVRIGRRLHRRFSEVSRHCPKLWCRFYIHDFVTSDGCPRSNHFYRCSRRRRRSPVERVTSTKCEDVAQPYYSSWDTSYLCTKPHYSCACKY